MKIRFPKIHFIALILINLGSQVISDAYDHRYSNGDTIPIYANRVGPYTKPLESHDYYDLPFCSPDVVEEKLVNLSDTLTVQRLVPTPYKIEFLVDTWVVLLCNKKLNKSDVSKFRSAVQMDYYMHLYCDDLEIQGFVGRSERDHRDGTIKNKYVLYTHYHIYILYNIDRVIEVVLQVDTNNVVDITEDKEVDVAFTYSVNWMPTQKPFNERMKRYNTAVNKLHAYSIGNSSFTIFLLIIGILIFYKRVISKDISKYRCDVEEVEMTDHNQEEIGWKSIHGDVFRFPRHKSLFAAALGAGSQLLVLMVAILIVSTMCAFQPPNLQDFFLKSLVVMYAVTSVVSGYTSVSFYYQMEGTNWTNNLLLTGGLHFGPLLLLFTFIYTVSNFDRSTAPFSLGEITIVSLLWILVAFPLLLLGAVIGKKRKPNFQAPCRTAKSPREVPQMRWYKHILPQMIFAGFLPFGVINIQLHDILYTIWGHGVYVYYNYMSTMFFLLLITTVLVSVVTTYFQLASEDHEWWWRSFFIGGSTGLYVYVYSIYYYFWLSDMNGLVQTSSFFGYMACVSYGIFLLLGSVGFHASLLFVRYLYASIKCD